MDASMRYVAMRAHTMRVYSMPQTTPLANSTKAQHAQTKTLQTTSDAITQFVALPALRRLSVHFVGAASEAGTQWLVRVLADAKQLTKLELNAAARFHIHYSRAALPALGEVLSACQLKRLCLHGITFAHGVRLQKLALLSSIRSARVSKIQSSWRSS